MLPLVLLAREAMKVVVEGLEAVEVVEAAAALVVVVVVVEEAVADLVDGEEGSSLLIAADSATSKERGPLFKSNGMVMCLGSKMCGIRSGSTA
jgi:hypothetical protein